MQWGSDPKTNWVAIYRLCVLGLLTVNMTLLLEHQVPLDKLLPQLFAVCAAAGR